MINSRSFFFFLPLDIASMKTFVEGLPGFSPLGSGQQNFHLVACLSSLLLLGASDCEAQHGWTNRGAPAHLGEPLSAVLKSKWMVVTKDVWA